MKYLGRELTAAAGFTSLLLFGMMKYPMSCFPELLNATIRARVSLSRLRKFMSAPDVSGMPPSGNGSGSGSAGGGDEPRSGELLICDETAVIHFREAGLGWSKVLERDEAPTDSAGSSCSVSAGDFLPTLPTVVAPSFTLPSIFSASTRMRGNSYDVVHQHPHQHQHQHQRRNSHSCEDEGLELHRKDCSEKEKPHVPVPVLSGLTVTIRHLDLCIVIGETASGKSTFLSGILGECKLLTGSITVASHPAPTFALVTQGAWIQNASIRDNILFGSAMDPARYAAVLRACGLEADLAQFPFGDSTEIGEKGVVRSQITRGSVECYFLWLMTLTAVLCLEYFWWPAAASKPGSGSVQPL